MRFKLGIKFEDGSTDNWVYNNFDNEIISERFGPINPYMNSTKLAQITYRPTDKVYKYMSDMRHLEINLGLECNMDCPACSQRLHRNEIHSASPKDIPSFIEKIQKAKHYGLNPSLIKFWGGEPLVHGKVLLELIPLLRIEFPDSIFSTTTNGTLLTKDWVDFFKQYNVVVNVSCDGFMPTKAKNIPILQDDDRKEILHYAHQVLGENFHLMTVVGDDCPRLDKTLETYDKEFDDNKMKVGVVMVKWNDGNKDVMKPFSTETKEQITEGMYQALITNHERLLHTRLFESFLKRLVDRDNIYSIEPHCYNVNQALIVDTLGNTYNCKFRIQRTGTLDNLNEFPSTNNTHFLYRKNCLNCPLVQVCGGGCPRQAEWEHDLTCDNSYYPNNLGRFKAAFKLLFNVEVVSIESIEQ